MRTAQSLPSVTSRRPVAKRRPLTNRSIGSSAWRSSSTTAPGGSPTISAEAICARPSSAHTRTGMPRERGRAGAAPAAAARGRCPARGSRRASRPARASCARRRRSARAARAGTARRTPRRRRAWRAGCARRRRSPRRRAHERARLRHADLDLRAEHGSRSRRRPTAIIWFIASADGGQLELGELVGAGGLVGLHAHHGGGEAARPVDRHHEQVAARDAVDVGDHGRHGGHRDALERMAIRRRRRRRRPA